MENNDDAFKKIHLLPNQEFLEKFSMKITIFGFG